MSPRTKYKMYSLLWLLAGFGIVPCLVVFIPSPWDWALLIVTAGCIGIASHYMNKADRTYGWPMPKDWEAELNRRIDEYYKRRQM